MTGRQPHFAERSHPQFGQYRQRSWLFLIDLALMNKNQAFIDANKAANHVAICTVVRCHDYVHAASVVNRHGRTGMVGDVLLTG